MTTESDAETEKDLLLEEDQQALPTRKSLQWSRRLFHMGMGLAIGLVYQFSLTHSRAIYILGMGACVVYIMEQIRINYSELSSKISVFNKYLFRAEEQLKESAGVPYVMGLLLTLISFPKAIALVAIYTLAIADPMSAIIGIRYGKRKISEHKSVEGSLAFFTSTFILCFLVFFWWTGFLSSMLGTVLLLSFLVAVIVTAFELIPIRLDDNLTIPIFTAIILWPLCLLLDIPI
jgi:dolichol kinase